MSDICAVTGLFHVLVKSNDLPQTLKFYKEVLGLREAPRPAFGNPGAWMAVSTPIGEQIIHVWAGGAGMGPTGKTPYGTAAIDHVSLLAIGHEGFRTPVHEVQAALARIHHSQHQPVAAVRL